MKHHIHTFLLLVTPSRIVSCCRSTFHLLTTYTAIGCFWVAIPIVDSAQYTIDNVYSLLQAYYLMGLILALVYQTFVPPIRQRLNLQP